jgi:hypothetical protein
MDKEFDRAWKLIAAPEQWCKGMNSQTDEGFGCHVDDPRAVRWCALGAILKVYGDTYISPGEAVAIVCINDAPKRTHTEVVEWLKERDL